MESKQTDIDLLDALLDKNLEDVEDLPEYLDRVANGFYKLKIVEVQRKTVETTDKDTKAKVDAPIIQFVFEVVECMELEDAAKEAPKVGARFNESVWFNKDVDKAAAVIKLKFKEVAEAWGASNLKELVNQLQGAEIAALVKTTADREKEDKFYIRVSNCRLA